MKKIVMTIISIVLVAAMIVGFSAFTYARDEGDYGEIDGIQVREKYDGRVGGVLVIHKPDGVDAISACVKGDITWSFSFDKGITEHDIMLRITSEHVSLLLVTEYEKNGEDYNETDKYFIVVVTHGLLNKDMGEITSLKKNDVAVYADNEEIFFGEAEVTDGEVGTYTCSYYVGENNCAIVSEDGTIKGVKPGVDNAVCYVIDAKGHVFSSEYTITVEEAPERSEDYIF